MVYGPPNVSDYASFWNNLETTTSNFGGPWLLVGDFNRTLSEIDRAGGNPVGAYATSTSFRSSVHRLSLIQLARKGTRVALSNWNKNQFGKLMTNIASLRSAISVLQSSDLLPDNIEKKRDLRCALSEQLLFEELY
ncbi:Endonuclease/exonuclease/phosphatase [Trema orientale]|uniref:Endonuclease/exonuclease/phosphatase n=1 Tax=Trema orientale TaxID=63057 RepID=A0A2P5AP80_TREOI|nr:Endonuclease/exonuclease/phosphatase [Trema orientale]